MFNNKYIPTQISSINKGSSAVSDNIDPNSFDSHSEG